MAGTSSPGMEAIHIGDILNREHDAIGGSLADLPDKLHSSLVFLDKPKTDRQSQTAGDRARHSNCTPS
jgi:hypothetical protein